MEEQDLELIERYFRQTLSGAELDAFRRRLEQDSAFREAVDLHGAALEAIRLEGSAALRARLTEKGRALDAARPLHPMRRWGWWSSLLLMLVLTIAWWRWPAPPPQNTPDPASHPSPAPPAVPEAPAPGAPVEKRETPAPKPPAAKPPSGKQLFATWYQPYRDDTLEPSVRGDADTLYPLEQFQLLYWQGKYREALAVYEKLSAAAQNNDNNRFIKANCLLATDQAAAAVPLLENIAQRNRSRFRMQTNWYLALGYLRLERRAEAETLLRTIAGDAGSPRQAEAGRLLGEMR